MNFARFAVLLSIAGALSVGLDGHAAPNDMPNRVEMRIELYGFAGFHVLTNRTTIEASADRYAITADLNTRGMARVFVDLNSHSEVQGQLAGNAPSPEAYRSDVRRNGVDRRYRIDYREDGPTASEWASPATAWRSPAPPAMLRGTVDQLTAYFLVERQLARHGNCRLSVPVFDGHGRYNLRFVDAKPETLNALGPQDFAGPTHVCLVIREDTPDFPGNRDPSEGTYHSGKVWYARLAPGGRMVPVRMEYNTEFGIVTGYLAELRGPGIDRRFIE